MKSKSLGKVGVDRYACTLSRVPLFTTPWAVACQAPLSMGFPRQEYWSGWLFPSPGGLPNQGIEPTSPILRGRLFTTEPPGNPCLSYYTTEKQAHPRITCEKLLSNLQLK